MKNRNVMIAAAVVGLLSFSNVARAGLFDYSSSVGAAIHFPGDGTFSFAPGVNNFKVTDGTAAGLFGEFTGTYTIGTITTSGGVSSAPVTGTGTLVIHDGVFNLSASVQWLDIVQSGTGDFLDNVGTVNLTSVTYGGTNPDLQTLAAAGTGINVMSFQFIPAVPLSSLVSESHDTSFSGTIVYCSGQIGDFVWLDSNGNGCQDAGEPGLPGVAVDLYSGCGTNSVFLRATNTDANGKYLFSELCAGTYSVRFHTPAGYLHTLAHQNCNVGGQPPDQTDSNCQCTGADDCDVCVTLMNDGSQDLSIDCGYIPNPPTCQISPGVPVCQGGSASFTNTPSGGTPPYTITWTGPNGFTGTGATITINNAQTANAGTYTATVTDAHGLQSACGVGLVVNPNPNCTITTSVTNTVPGATNLLASVANAGAGATYIWTVNNGSITAGQGSASITWTAGNDTNNPVSICVTVTSGAGCPSTCCKSVPLTPLPPPKHTNVGHGDTATIGFWHNKNGQALINSMPNPPALGNWLASNFPCLYGNLAGKTNGAVAAQFLTFFGVTGQKTYAQIMSAALASYVTDPTLGGNNAANYGFNMGPGGTGAKYYNVGALGTAIGLQNNTSYSVLQLLQAANAKCPFNSTVSNALNTIFDGINTTGDIN